MAVVHAPESSLHTGKPTSLPLCNTRADHPVVADGKVLDTITCRSCIRALHDQAQWWNILQQEGFKVATPQRRARRGRKPDPRQTSFSDLLGA